MANCNSTDVVRIAKVFGECVSTPRKKVSFSIDLISTCFAADETIPQTVLNFKKHSADGMAIEH
jgi:hypothetical protein